MDFLKESAQIGRDNYGVVRMQMRNWNNIIKSVVHFYLVFFLVSKMFRIFAIKSAMIL